MFWRYCNLLRQNYTHFAVGWWFSLARSLTSFGMTTARSLSFRVQREIFPAPGSRATIKLNHHLPLSLDAGASGIYFPMAKNPTIFGNTTTGRRENMRSVGLKDKILKKPSARNPFV